MPLESLLTLVEKLRKRIDDHGPRTSPERGTNPLRAD